MSTAAPGPHATTRSCTSPRAICRRTLVTLAAVVLTGLALAAPAHAEDGYTYWNYFHVQDGGYVFADTGPGDHVPEDGSIEAYRYGTSTMSQQLPPRADLTQVDFGDLCAAESADAGQKRVGVLLDYGTTQDAADGATPPEPRGACAVVPEDATGQQVLSSVADVRIEGGLTCGIDGYPVQGCGTPVKNAQVPTDQQPVAFTLPGGDGSDAAGDSAGDSEEAAGADADTDAVSAQAEEDDSGLLWPLVGAVVLVLLIAVGALVMNRRRASA